MKTRVCRMLRPEAVRLFATVVLTAALFTAIWTELPSAAPRRTTKKQTPAKTTAKSKSKPTPRTKASTKTDTAATVKPTPAPPPRPILPFAELDRWIERSSRGGSIDEPAGNAARSVELICRYFSLGFDITSPLHADLSPHEWPQVFADQVPNPRRQRLEIEKMMTLNTLKFSDLVTAEPKDLADIFARAVDDGDPVLLNAPTAPIIYGYDRREPDAWWLIQWRGHQEIVYESDRMRSLVWWTDDPAANVAWSVSGPDTTAATSKLQYDDFEWLQKIASSVNGNDASGVKPYPLTIRAFRDRLDSTAALPDLRDPIDSLDPLGIHRVKSYREYTVDVIERLAAMAVDTTLSQPLRLALYFFHNSSQSISRLDSLMYDAVSGPSALAHAKKNWADPKRKAQGVEALTQILEWERQAMQQVAIALQVHEKESH